MYSKTKYKNSASPRLRVSQIEFSFAAKERKGAQKMYPKNNYRSPRSPRLRASLASVFLCVLCGLIFSGCAETPTDGLFPPARYSENLPAHDKAAAPSDRILGSALGAQTASFPNEELRTKNEESSAGATGQPLCTSVSSVVYSRGDAEARRKIS